MHYSAAAIVVSEAFGQVALSPGFLTQPAAMHRLMRSETTPYLFRTRWRLPVKRERATNKGSGSLTQWSQMANSCRRLEHDDPQVLK